MTEGVGLHKRVGVLSAFCSVRHVRLVTGMRGLLLGDLLVYRGVDVLGRVPS